MSIATVRWTSSSRTCSAGARAARRRCPPTRPSPSWSGRSTTDRSGSATRCSRIAATARSRKSRASPASKPRTGPGTRSSWTWISTATRTCSSPPGTCGTSWMPTPGSGPGRRSRGPSGAGSSRSSPSWRCRASPSATTATSRSRRSVGGGGSAPTMRSRTAWPWRTWTAMGPWTSWSIDWARRQRCFATSPVRRAWPCGCAARRRTRRLRARRSGSWAARSPCSRKRSCWAVATSPAPIHSTVSPPGRRRS